MWVLKACRACLTTKGKLEKIDPKLKRIFSALTELKILEGDGLPTYFCTECLWTLRKAMVFRRRSQRAYYVFKEILLVRKQVTLKDLEAVDRKKTNLISPYSRWSPKDCVVYTVTTPDARDDIPSEEVTPEMKQAIKDSLDMDTESKPCDFDFNLKVDKEKGIYNLEIEPLQNKENVPNSETISTNGEFIKQNSNVIENASILVDIKPANYKEIERQEEEENKRLRQLEIDQALKEIADDGGDTIDDGPYDDGVPEDIDLDDVFKGLQEASSEDDSLPELEPLPPKWSKKKIAREEKKKAQAPIKNAVRATANLLSRTKIRYMTHEEQKEAFMRKVHDRDFLQSLYKCALCVSDFNSMEELFNHVEYHRKKAEFTFACDICKDRFENEEAILMHKAECHWYEYTCTSCDEKHYALDDLMVCHDDVDAGSAARAKSDKAIKNCFTKTELEPKDYCLTVKVWTGKKSNYSCSTHKIYFMNPMLLDKHMKTHDGERRASLVKCDVCGLYMSSTSRLLSHMADWHQFKYSCDRCQYKCWNRMQAHKHALEHLKAEEKEIMKREGGTHSEKLDCNVCGATSLNRRLFYLHQLSEHRFLRLNTVAELNDPEFHCSICNVYFMNKQAHYKHLARNKHEQAKLYQFGCKRCFSLYESKQELNEHACPLGYTTKYSTFYSVYPKKCCYCDEMLENYSAYARHFHRQHADLPYRRTKADTLCEYCGKELMLNEAKSHRQLHELPPTEPADNDYRQCRHCNNKFQTPLTYVTHILNRHTWKPFKCTYCENRFQYRCDLRDHILKGHVPVQPYRCEACERRFSHLDYLHDHCLKAHRVDLKKTDKSVYLSTKMRGKVHVYPHMQIDGSLIHPEILKQVTVYLCDYLHDNVEEVDYKDYFFFDLNAVPIQGTSKHKKPRDDKIERKRTKKGKDKEVVSGVSVQKKSKIETNNEKQIKGHDEFSEVRDAVSNLPKLLSDDASNEYIGNTSSDHENINYSIRVDGSNFQMEYSNTENSNLSDSQNQIIQDEGGCNFSNENSNTEISKDGLIYEETEHMSENTCIEYEGTETVETEDVIGQLVEKDGVYFVLVDDQLYQLE